MLLLEIYELCDMEYETNKTRTTSKLIFDNSFTSGQPLIIKNITHSIIVNYIYAIMYTSRSAFKFLAAENLIISSSSFCS